MITRNSAPFAASADLSGRARALCIALLLVLVQGCKLTLIAPPGGAIESRTGDNDCPAGQTCEIDIPGVPFSDTFTAVPDPGYIFLGWKPGYAFLCHNKTTPCELENIPASVTAQNFDLNLEAVFELDLLALLPDTTRGVMQLVPGQAGALGSGAAMHAWSMGPLQLLQELSVGLNIENVARRIVLAQLGDAPEQFILSAALASTDVDTLTAGLSLTAAGTHQGYAVWAINGSDLHFVKLDDATLLIAPLPALQRALDAFTGAGPSVQSGPLGPYLSGLGTGWPNSFVYGLPAMYGPVAAPGDGDTSLSQARVVTAAFAVDGDDLTGGLAFFANNANDYVSRLNTLLSGYPGPQAGATGGVSLVNLNGLSVSNDVLPLLKTLVLDMDAVDYTDSVVHGGNVPWLNFEVGGDPAAIFINFEFTGPTEIAAFEAAHLPPGFSLVPFRMMENDPLRYLMVLNIYQSSGGLVEGARAEWSVFVADPNTAEPRFMVIEAKAENLSADSVNLLTQPEPVSYELQAGFLESYVGIVDPQTEIETTYFSASIPWPQLPSTHVPFDRFFMPANDFVFWGNAVADKTLYNSTAANRDGAVVPAGQFTYQDNTPWDAFLNNTPVHAVVYLNNQEIVISPWWNLDANYLDVTPTYLQTLINFKNNFYPLTVQTIAAEAIQGDNIALSATTISDTVPTVHYHFPLLDPTGLLTAAAGPGVHTPATVALFDGEAAGHFLTLSVEARKDDPCGLRARWVTYVQGADGRPQSLQLDTASSEACLDPVNLLTLASPVTQAVNASQIDTLVSTAFIQFQASVNLALANNELVGLDWLEATERVCSLNDVCDEYYYDGQRVTVPAQRASGAALQVTNIVTPWNSYIDTGAGRAAVRSNAALQVFNAWRNQRAFAGSAPAP